MTLQWTKSFIKDYQKLPQQLQKRVDEKLGFLLEDYRRGSLRAKKVKGSIKGQKVTDIYELSVTMGTAYSTNETVKPIYYSGWALTRKSWDANHLPLVVKSDLFKLSSARRSPHVVIVVN